MTQIRFSKLLVDAGSTKTDWVALDAAGEECGRHASIGLNALMANEEDILNLFIEISSVLPDPESGCSIFYYGAGCASPEICAKIKRILYKVWTDSYAEVNTDLVGAARALLGNSPGIACILGTGSNSCLYNGSEIVKNVPSLGYILGDEGSGAALGKRLIKDAFKGYLPENVRDKMLQQLNLTLPEILDRVYNRPGANRFLASLVPFIKENLWNPYVYGMVIKEFSHFFRRNVAMYPDSRRLPICFTGSIAWHFSKQLEEAAESQGFRVHSIVKSPIEGIIAYHK